MKTELMDVIKFDGLLKKHADGCPESRKEIIEYLQYLHEKIRRFDLINDVITSHIGKSYE